MRPTDIINEGKQKMTPSDAIVKNIQGRPVMSKISEVSKKQLLEVSEECLVDKVIFYM